MKAAPSAWRSCTAGLGHHCSGPVRASPEARPDPVPDQQGTAAVAETAREPRARLLGTRYTVRTAHRQQLTAGAAALQTVEEASARRLPEAGGPLDEEVSGPGAS
ncbi:hypothetical protein ABTX81_17885 [Kitasatospora sp. NPDC097605]|uniref:hypothetical protein n=1 Tax=Kitasatospora sp. NPDC097605 TaxID=3157226 RepID=UPI00331BCEB3